jgi:hypothetical protein
MPDEMRDTSRPAATAADNRYALTIEAVAERYLDAGFPRSLRTLQRYCSAGHLEAIKAPTQLGDIYLVTPESVARHIGELRQVLATTWFATGRDTTRPVAMADAAAPRAVAAASVTPTDPDTPRPVATELPVSSPDAGVSHYVERLEDEVIFLRGQISTKDSQIKELTERSRETNVLIGGLQKMLTPLLGNGPSRSNERPGEGDEPYRVEHP